MLIKHSKYILQSKIDNQMFEVNQKIIDASILLKNVCDLTNVNESIIVDCSALCLDIFIILLNHYENISIEKHDIEFEEDLYKILTNVDQIIGLIRDICLLDSDFFLDSYADLILRRIKKMDWKQMKEFFGFEDDFNSVERELINENKLEYLLSINVKSEKAELKFPFSNKSFISVKSKFHSPLNALLARIILRSKEGTALNLSLINKTIKNEFNRHPIKVSKFRGYDYWQIIINTTPRFHVLLSMDKYDERYFNVIKARKIIAETNVSLTYAYGYEIDKPEENNKNLSSMDFVIPYDTMTELDVDFQGDSNENDMDLIYFFNIEKCPFPSISYSFNIDVMDFNIIYKYLIAKDFSKNIELYGDGFGFHSWGSVRLFKKPNATMFHKCEVYAHAQPLPPFKEFVKNYMGDNDIIQTVDKISCIPDEFTKKIKADFIYKASSIKKYL